MSNAFAPCFDALNDLAVCRDARRCIVRVNQAFARTFGGAPEDWVDRHFDGAESGAQIGAFHDSRAYGHVRAGGRAFWIEWDETPLPDGGTIAIGRLNQDRRSMERSQLSQQRDRRRNKATIFVPAERPKAGPAAAPPPANLADNAQPGKIATTSVLLVEDDPLSAKLVTALLQREQCQVTHCTDGEAALVLARRQSFDLVLMDMRLPGISGPEACAAMRKLGGVWGELPVIALTANAFENDRQICLKAGMTGFVTKPIDAQTLSAVCQRWTAEQKQAKLA